MPAHRGETAHGSVWKKMRPTIDHIRPRSKGGDDGEANVQLAHARCNRMKGDRWPP
ncbi:MAG: HNH endonuclease [Pseudomonadota bacterium]